MLKRMAILLAVAIILTSSALVWGKEDEKGLKVGDSAPEFTLKDAYDKEHSFKLLLDKEETKIAVLLMGNRKARKDANKWARELHKIYGKQNDVVLLMLADLRDLPFFVTEGMIKWGTKREKLPVTILLDWEGKVNQKYKTQKNKTDLFIVGSDGKVLYYQAEKHSDEAFTKVTTKMQDILKDNRQKM